MPSIWYIFLTKLSSHAVTFADRAGSAKAFVPSATQETDDVAAKCHRDIVYKRLPAREPIEALFQGRRGAGIERTAMQREAERCDGLKILLRPTALRRP